MCPLLTNLVKQRVHFSRLLQRFIQEEAKFRDGSQLVPDPTCYRSSNPGCLFLEVTESSLPLLQCMAKYAYVRVGYREISRYADMDHRNQLVLPVFLCQDIRDFALQELRYALYSYAHQSNPSDVRAAPNLSGCALFQQQIGSLRPLSRQRGGNSNQYCFPGSNRQQFKFGYKLRLQR